MRDFMNRIEELWCANMHSSVMWPIHGKYRCGDCLREYTVGFEAGEGTEIPRPAVGSPLVSAH
jgi:hypothetical protein